MSLFVDTTVWSLAFRRDSPEGHEIDRLAQAVAGGETIVTTGLVLQEILQGFAGPKARDKILERLSSLPYLVPDRQDYIQAADLQSVCRRGGMQILTVDALLAQLCIRHDLLMLSTDADFRHMARHCPLQIWRA